MRTLTANMPVVYSGRNIGAARQRDRLPLFLVMFFWASTGAMVLTGSLITLAIWAAIWYLAVSKKLVYLPGAEPLKLYIAFTLFYPTIPPGAGSLQEYTVVKAGLLGVVLILHWREIQHAIRASKWFRLLLFGWVAWGTLGYLPVLVTWVMTTLLGFPGWDWLGTYRAETTMLKSGFPVIIAVVAAILPVAALKAPPHFRRFANWLFGASMLLILLSAVETVLGFRFVIMPYDADSTRMTAFSLPDPNDYARLLLMPTLFGVSFALRRRTVHDPAKSWLAWFVAASGICSILLTLSRTAYVALAVGLFVLFALNARRARTVVVAAVIGAVAVIAFVSFGLAGRFAPGEERRSTSNFDSRVAIYKSLVQIVHDRPWFGSHPGGSYMYALYEVGHGPEGIAFDYDNYRTESPHNQLFGLAAQWGIPMATLFLLTWVATVVYGFRALRIARILGPAPGMSDLEAVAQAEVALGLAYFVEGLGSHLHPDLVFWIFGMSLAVWYCLAGLLAAQGSVRAQAGVYGQ